MIQKVKKLVLFTLMFLNMVNIGSHTLASGILAHGDYWNGADYADNSFLQRSNVEKALEEIFTWYKSQEIKPKRILDLGCGTGEHTRTLAKNFPDAQVIGLDKSPSMLAQAKQGEALPNLSFIDGDVETMNFSQEPFDLIVSFYTMHWVKNQLEALKRTQQCLAIKGRLYIIYVPSKEGLPYDQVLHETMKSSRWSDRFTGFFDVLYKFDTEQYRKFLIDAGLTIIEIRYQLDHKAFPTSDALKNWCKQWNQQHKHLGSADGEAFLNDLFERYFALIPPSKDGKTHWEEYLVTAIAMKREPISAQTQEIDKK